MLDESKLQPFTDTLHSRLIRPDDPEYDETRALWNSMIDRKPALIGLCKSTKG